VKTCYTIFHMILTHSEFPKIKQKISFLNNFFDSARYTDSSCASQIAENEPKSQKKMEHQQ
jgi:hypothetical protein